MSSPGFQGGQPKRRWQKIRRRQRSREKLSSFWSNFGFGMKWDVEEEAGWEEIDDWCGCRVSSWQWLTKVALSIKLWQAQESFSFIHCLTKEAKRSLLVRTANTSLQADELEWRRRTLRDWRIRDWTPELLDGFRWLGNFNWRGTSAVA